ncbi:2-hydroxymuconic semialdehyde dehydrogenase [Tribonema minus]|uniref:Aldehyde dehydrogenase n=1 Tax=Tribonema minus TaxID=303371 RepID=A0A835ZHT8_9STRA|nr:2-hydroxymuconic semialdehyde dehydrogenase [Tribonema minus]
MATPVSEMPSIVSDLRASFATGLTRPLSFRKSQLQHIEALVDENLEQLSSALTADMGSRATKIRVCLDDVKKQVRYMMSTLDKKARAQWEATPPDAQDVGRWKIVPEPYGVVLIIAPWNFPFNLVMVPLIAAIAAGNVVVIKPSEVAANTTALIADLIPKYLDARAVRVVLGAVPETTALLEQRFDKICYTGGTKVGRVVAAAAARHLTPTLLELGGKQDAQAHARARTVRKCPVYVHKSADMPIAAERTLRGRFANCGQFCIAADYVLADREVMPLLVQEMKAALPRVCGADPKTSDLYGRIVSEAHVDRIAAFLQEEHGGTIIAGGKVDRDSRYVEPTIVLAPTADSKMLSEEIFGPILPLVPIDGGIDEAISCVNAGDTPLAAYVFAEDKNVAERWVERVSAGGMAVNAVATQLDNVNVPFGGKGESGMGAYRGAYNFDDRFCFMISFTHHKTVLIAHTGKRRALADLLARIW